MWDNGHTDSKGCHEFNGNDGRAAIREEGGHVLPKRQTNDAHRGGSNDNH